MIILFYFLFVICPILFWLGYFLVLDKREPEPKKFLLKIFFLGIGIAFFAAAIETLALFPFFPNIELEFKAITNETDSKTLPLFIGLMIGAVVEELLKFFSIWEYSYYRNDFNQILDGTIYGITLALGFVLVENSFYFLNLYLNSSKELFIAAVITRGILTTLMHITTAGIIGYGLGRKKFTKDHSKKTALYTLLLAVFIHVGFNLLIFLPGGIIAAFILVAISFLYLFFLLNRTETKLVWRIVNRIKN